MSKIEAEATEAAPAVETPAPAPVPTDALLLALYKLAANMNGSLLSYEEIYACMLFLTLKQALEDQKAAIEAKFPIGSAQADLDNAALALEQALEAQAQAATIQIGEINTISPQALADRQAKAQIDVARAKQAKASAEENLAKLFADRKSELSEAVKSFRMDVGSLRVKVELLIEVVKNTASRLEGLKTEIEDASFFALPPRFDNQGKQWESH